MGCLLWVFWRKLCCNVSALCFLQWKIRPTEPLPGSQQVLPPRGQLNRWWVIYMLLGPTVSWKRTSVEWRDDSILFYVPDGFTTGQHHWQVSFRSLWLKESWWHVYHGSYKPGKVMEFDVGLEKWYFTWKSNWKSVKVIEKYQFEFLTMIFK